MIVNLKYELMNMSEMRIVHYMCLMVTNTHRGHLITVLAKHVHMPLAPQKPIIKRENSGMNTTNLAFQLVGGEKEPTMRSLTRSYQHQPEAITPV